MAETQTLVASIAELKLLPVNSTQQSLLQQLRAIASAQILSPKSPAARLDAQTLVGLISHLQVFTSESTPMRLTILDKLRHIASQKLLNPEVDSDAETNLSRTASMSSVAGANLARTPSLSSVSSHDSIFTPTSASQELESVDSAMSSGGSAFCDELLVGAKRKRKPRTLRSLQMRMDRTAVRKAVLAVFDARYLAPPRF
jgi:hypothetical protein